MFCFLADVTHIFAIFFFLIDLWHYLSMISRGVGGGGLIRSENVTNAQH